MTLSRRRSRGRWLGAALALAALAPGAALAQSDADKATARALATEGQEAFEKKDYATAADRFARADALYHAPTLAIGLARAQAGQGKLVAAQETYNKIVREGVPPKASDAFVKAVADAKRELAALEPRVPWAVLSVEGPDEPKVLLDGAPLSTAALGVKRAIDPGKHKLQASGPGFAPKETTFDAPEGATQTVKLTLDKAPVAGAGLPPGSGPAAPPPPPPAGPDRASSGGGGWMKPVGITAVVLGGVGIAAGAVTGVLAIGEHAVLEDDCPLNRCSADSETTLDNFHTLSTISTIGFIGGVVLLGGGITLVALAPKSRDTGATIAPYVGAGQLGARGTF